jgi:hypothetical protein
MRSPTSEVNKHSAKIKFPNRDYKMLKRFNNIITQYSNRPIRKQLLHPSYNEQ